MEILRTGMPGEAEKLVNYFDLTYVPGTYEKVGSKHSCLLKISKIPL